MNPISKEAALKFCELCNWTYEAWITHKVLFEKNLKSEANIGKSAYFTSRLSNITQEYSLLQITKLHDPAIIQGSLNLTINFMVRFGDWGTKEDHIKKIESKLAELWQHIKPARNKALCHNDLETFMHNSTLGEFPVDKDDEYFVALQDLVNEVHEKWADGPYPFNDLAIADVKEFLAVLERA